MRWRTPCRNATSTTKDGNPPFLPFERRGVKSALTFVEVKTRRTAAELDFAIDERRLARVAAAAEVLMARYAGPGDDIRVDVILLAPGTRPRHIENAWIGAG